MALRIHVALSKQKDIFISLYNPHDTIYTNQTGKFPHASSRGYHYQMIVHKIDGNSTWVEPMKNKSQGEMIRARRAALLIMKLQHIVPLRQILDNEISEVCKE